mmetsp:Transcript_57892/g.153915  ORF Transcript_57892/g.153915 Transcript_57892/m.153915 type:complete len:246 (+) Transcript_57892:373-1110(+)
MYPRLFLEWPTCSTTSPLESHLTSDSPGSLSLSGANGSGCFTTASSLDPSSGRLTTLQMRFLSHELPGARPLPPPAPSLPPVSRRGSCAASSSPGRAGDCAGSSSSASTGAKKRGPPCDVASHVTQPRLFRGAFEEAEGSAKAMGMRVRPSSTSCGPLCSTTAPQKSIATSGLSSERLSRTTMSPRGSPLVNTTCHVAARTGRRYLGPPTAVASTVAQPRDRTGMRTMPCAWPLTKISAGPACWT